nr:50S ribosome-binding GTPase [Gammaproteobacteria bacterium]
MKTDWKHWLQLTLRSRDFGWYLLLVGVIPLVLLAVTGFYFLARDGSLLSVLLAWTTLALAVAAWLSYRQRKSPTDSDNPINPAIPSLQPAPDWTEQDHAAWELAQVFIDQHVEADTPWITLRELAIEQHTLLARHYVPTEKNHHLSFTLPELLLVLEITSARYRAFIRENIPFADSIQLATVKTLYDKKDSARKGYRFINTARRVLRLTNPLVAATGEIRDHISGKLLGQASHTLTLELKRVLLQELAQVAIDLYSGRLKVADAELAEYVSSATRNDLARQAEPIESLRIAVAGQTNAGKSTLINALRRETAPDSPEQPQSAHITPAETDVLPTTDATRVYPWQL